MFKLQHLDHVAISVRDIDRSVDWYAKTLGLEKRNVWDGEPVMLYAGDTCLALFSADGRGIEMSESERRRHLTARHIAFKVDLANFDGAQKEFRDKAIDSRFADHGVCHSVYIDDPDGHTIELTTYEVD
ncbi:MAG: VOC family protein [Chloroflexota bacterium]|nr:VOC family protein [Chloroflexota bacterium]